MYALGNSLRCSEQIWSHQRVPCWVGLVEFFYYPQVLDVAHPRKGVVFWEEALCRCCSQSSWKLGGWDFLCNPVSKHVKFSSCSVAVTDGFLSCATPLLHAYSRNSCSGTGADLEKLRTPQNQYAVRADGVRMRQSFLLQYIIPDLSKLQLILIQVYPRGSLLLVIMLCSNHACFVCHNQEVLIVISTQSNLCLMIGSNYSCKDGNPPSCLLAPSPGVVWS